MMRVQLVVLFSVSYITVIIILDGLVIILAYLIRLANCANYQRVAYCTCNDTKWHSKLY